MLWELAQAKRAADDAADGEKRLAGEYAAEMREWVELTNALSAELNALRAGAGRVGELEAENYRLQHQKTLLEDDARARADELASASREIGRLRDELAARELALEQLEPPPMPAGAAIAAAGIGAP